MKHLTKISDLTEKDIESIINQAFKFKDSKETQNFPNLNKKVVALVFEKPSLRTKVAFEVAAHSLNMTPVFLSSSQIFASGGKVSGRESIYDISKNLERFVDIILARVFSHSVIEEVSSNVKIPVINALCDLHHPTQALADLMCIRWHNQDNKKIKVAYVGDGNNVANSLVQILAKSGIDVAIATPSNYEIPNKELEIAKSFAEKNNSKIEITNSPIEAVNYADFIYTDTFISMGQEDEKEKRLNDFKDFQVNLELIQNAKPNVKFMHCLPAHRGEEVTDEIMDSENSIVFDQAECRLHIAKSLFWFFLN